MQKLSERSFWEGWLSRTGLPHNPGANTVLLLVMYHSYESCSQTNWAACTSKQLLCSLVYYYIYRQYLSIIQDIPLVKLWTYVSSYIWYTFCLFVYITICFWKLSFMEIKSEFTIVQIFLITGIRNSKWWYS